MTPACSKAQLAKYRRILGQLARRSGRSIILEIGCGWGGFAEIAASEAGAQVRGLTLSPSSWSSPGSVWPMRASPTGPNLR